VIQPKCLASWEEFGRFPIFMHTKTAFVAARHLVHISIIINQRIPRLPLPFNVDAESNTGKADRKTTRVIIKMKLYALGSNFSQSEGDIEAGAFSFSQRKKARCMQSRGRYFIDLKARCMQRRGRRFFTMIFPQN